jgi:hypothetical protein
MEIKKHKINAKEIAIAIYADGGRSRDCGVREALKTKYDAPFASKILDKLAEVEYFKLTQAAALRQ